METKKKTRREKTPQQVVEDVFSEAIAFSKGHAPKRSARFFDLTGPVLRRRKTAVMNYLPQIKEKYGSQFQGKTAEEVWAEECTAMVYTINGIDATYHTSLAAAIYILDILNQHGLLYKALPILEMDPEKISYDFIPDIHIPRYDERILSEMIHIIRQRDGQKHIYDGYINEVSARRTTPTSFTMPDHENKDISQWTERERFDAIMSLLPPIYMERAVGRFEKNMWAFLDTLYSMVNEYVSVIKKLDTETDELYSKYLNLDQKLHFSPKSGSPFMPPVQTDSSRMQDVKTMEGLSSQIMKSQANAEEISDSIQKLVRFSHAIPIETQEETSFINQEDADKIRALGVEDPYETCFGFLCLMESGSDLPWIYNAPAAVLLMAARKLPWTAFIGESEYDEEWEEDWEDEEEWDESENEERQSELEQSIPSQPLDWIQKKKEFYELRYTDYPLYAPQASPAKGWNLNLPQIVYGLTKTVMPRNLHWFDETAEDLVTAGMAEDFAECLELYLQLASESGSPAIDHSLYSHLKPDAPAVENTPEEDSQEEKAETQTAEQLNQSLQEAKLEISRLKQALYEAEKSAHSFEQEIARMKDQSAEERQELAELREMIYLQSNAQEEQPETESQIVFPYRMQKRIVVYGGHESWRKAIRPMLPDVTFIPRGQKPNPELIRNQDQIWIQPNAMAHKDFYRLINSIRLYHIPVRYFSYASARKCAIQLVESDQ